MQSNWTEKIIKWIDGHREEMIADIVRLVRIKSVSDTSSAVKPYGQGCLDALHEMLRIAQGYGFQVKNYEDTIGEIDLGYPGEDIGFWGHLDVVPEGDGWDYPPYEGIVEHGLIIGRGAQDNKGQTVAVLFVMRCIKELGIPLQHNLKLFVGTSEENGMEDLTWFLADHAVPSFSIIADSNYPVCFGEKGIVTAHFTGPKLSGNMVDIWGGTAPNVVPDKAGAVVKCSEEALKKLRSAEGNVEIEEAEDGYHLLAKGSAGHTAFPQHAVNAVRVLTHALCEEGVLSPEDRAILAFCDQINDDYLGTGLGVNSEDDVSGPLTCVGSMLTLQDGAPCMTVNIRYPVTGEAEWITEKLQSAAESAGYTLTLERVDPAHYFPEDHPVVHILTDIFNDITGRNQSPFVLPGGTYSRKLKKAISYGMGFTGGEHPDKKGYFRPGHGGAHGPDECTVIAELLVSIRIYAEGLLAIDDLDLS